MTSTLATVLYNLTEKAPIQQKEWVPNDTLVSRCGTVTTIKLLQAMNNATGTNIPEIDSEITVRQLNWCQIVEPAPGTVIRTSDGARLWFPVLLRDFHGTMTMYMSEAAALECSNQATPELFEAAHAAGRLCFPIVSSVKIVRKPTGKGGAVDHHILQASEQELDAAPTTKTLTLFDILHGPNLSSGVEQPADTFLVASLKDITASSLYPLTVRYSVQEAEGGAEMYILHCRSVLTLVKSTLVSDKQAIGDEGMTVITHGVKDMLSEDDRSYTLTAHCTTDTHMDFLLTPPKRVGHTLALVVICGALSDSSAEQPVSEFLVESVLPINTGDAESTNKSMLKIISLLIAGRRPEQEKRKHVAWTPEANPSSVAKCRRLSKYPAGPEMPEYLCSPSAN